MDGRCSQVPRRIAPVQYSEAAIRRAVSARTAVFFFQARIANREKAVLLLRSCRATRILRGPTSGQSSQSLLLPQSILAMRKDSDKKTFAK